MTWQPFKTWEPCATDCPVSVKHASEQMALIPAIVSMKEKNNNNNKLVIEREAEQLR